MRIRCIKPEFWADEQIASWPATSRLAYVALWNEADDEGRLRAGPVYLRSRLFPYDVAIDMDEVLKPIIKAGKLKLYDVDGQTYGHLPKFKDHQVINRPSPSKLPAPPAANSVRTHGAFTEHSHQERKGKEQGTGKGKEQGTGRTSAPCDIQAEAIYKEYPLKAAKPEALKAIRKAIEKAGFDHVLERTKAYATIRASDKAFMPHPATWFNQERYNDDPETWKRSETAKGIHDHKSGRVPARPDKYANVGTAIG